jgi:AAA15 family ATPase/GTPase
MNSIRDIEIRHFKSIQHLKIDGCKRINVFIGFPNTGKSNILEALSLFSVDRPKVRFSTFIRAEALTTLFFNGNVVDEIEIRINGNNVMLGGLMFSSEIRFTWLLEDHDLIPPQAKDILHYNKVETVDEITDWDSIFTRQVRSHEFVEDLQKKGLLADIKKYNFQKNSNYYSVKYDSLAVPFGENIFDIVRTHQHIRSEVAALFDFYNLELLYNSTEKKFSILKRLDKGTVFTIPYPLVSDTLQRLVFYKAAIKSNKDSILLFEEPEAHMFPPYMREFTADVIFDKSNQFFIATHSPYILDAFALDAKDDLAVYLVYYENGETKIKLMSEKNMDDLREYGVDLFYNLESYLKHGQVNNA